MVRLFLLYAILIFAKKAPKMIMDLLNIKGEGIGLKGLNIKNKMGEAALVGGTVKKGMTDVHGRVRKGSAGFVSGLIHGKRGEKLASAKKGLATGFATGGAEARANGENGVKGLWSKGYNDTKGVTRGGRPTVMERIGGKFDKMNANIAAQGTSSLTTAHSKEADNFRKSLEQKYGKDGANRIMAALNKKHGVNGRVRFENSDEYEAYKKDLKAISEAYTPDNIKNILKNDKGIQDVISGKQKAIADIDTRLNDPNISQNEKIKLNAEKTRLEAELNSYKPGKSVAIAPEKIDGAEYGISGYVNDMNIEKYGTGILMKKDLLTERGKRLDKIKNAYDSYRDLRQSNMDTTQVEAELQKLFNDAAEDGLFNDYPGMGVDSVNLTLNYEEKEIQVPITKPDGTPELDDNGNQKYEIKKERIINSLGNLDNRILENTKKLKGTESDIERMKAVEAEKPSTDKK